MSGLIFLIAAGTYLMSIAPSVTVGDSGELVAAAYTLGVAHPPGYPFYVAAGKAFSMLVPFGNVAFRINLFSLVCSALASAWIFSWLRDAWEDRGWSATWAAACGAGVFVVARTVWLHSILAEVITLHLLVLTGVCWALARMEGSGTRRTGYFAAALMVMAMFHHQSAVLVLPAVMGLVWPQRAGWTWGGAALALLVAGCMAGIFLLLPLRSLANPMMDWGNPESVKDFLHTVLRQQYSFKTSEPRALAMWMGQLGVWGGWQAREIGWALLGLSVFGLGVGRWTSAGTSGVSKRWAGAMVWWWGSVAVGMVAIGNFKLIPFDIEMNEVFWAPCALAAAWGIAAGTRWWMRHAHAWAWMVVLGVVAWQAHVSSSALAHFREPTGYWHGRHLLAMPEEPSWKLVAGEDNDIFPVTYHVVVEGYGDPRWVWDDLGCVITRVYGDDFKWLNQPAQFLRMKTEQFRLLNEAPEPKYFSLAAHMGNVVLEHPRADAVPVGPVYRVVPMEKGWTGMTGPENERALRLKETRGLDARAWRRAGGLRPSSLETMLGWDAFSRTMMARYAFMRAEHDLAAGRTGGALRRGAEAAMLGRDISWMQNSLGNIFARSGLMEFAVESYQRVIPLEPRRPEPHSNLGGIYMSQGRVQDAIREFETALNKNPSYIPAYVNLGVVYKNLGRLKEAREMWEQGLKWDPENVPLKVNLRSLSQ